MSAAPPKPETPDETPPLAELERQSEDLKARIDEARKKNAMPINASLGNPAIDARNADGRKDLPDEDDDR